MLIEDEPTKPPPPHAALDRMGIEELHGYIAALRAEIGRAEAEIGRKQKLRSAADDVFRRP